MTLRTSILGPEIRRFIGIYSWFSNQKREVFGFDKAYFSGITSLELAKIILHIINNNFGLYGIYNLSSKKISKYKLLNVIKEVKKMNIEIIKSNSEIYDRSLNNAKFRTISEYRTANWEDMILELINYE